MSIECACGAVIRGRSEPELLEAAQLHINNEHAQLGEPPSAADLLAMASEGSAGDGNANASNLSRTDTKEQRQWGT